MSQLERYKKEIDSLERGEGSYEWDELEELIMDSFDEGQLTSDEYDSLMRKLMSLDM